MQKLQNNVTPIIDTTWITIRDIKKYFDSQKELQKTITNASKLRTHQHLLQRASAHDIQNRKTSSKKIINMIKIENIIKTWKRINLMTNNRSTVSLNTLDIQIDTNIHRNDIKIIPAYSLKLFKIMKGLSTIGIW